MAKKIVRDTLGEIENPSIFEVYPQFAKRLSILVIIFLIGAGGTWYWLSREKPIDCSQTEASLHHEECSAGLYCVREYRGPQCLELWVEKKTPQPLTISLWLDKLQMDGIDGPAFAQLEDNTPRRLYSLAWPAGKTVLYHLRHIPVSGTRSVTHKPDAPYEIPLPSSIGYYVINPYNPSINPSNLGLEHAITFAVASGTPVYAMREGTVVAVRDDQTASGNRDEAIGKENYILIAHFDGTTAMYSHLQKQSVTVKPGEKVTPMTVIGVSGSSGFTEQPMLTVSVSGPGKGPNGVKSYPITFATREGNRVLKRLDTAIAPPDRKRSQHLPAILDASPAKKT